MHFLKTLIYFSSEAYDMLDDSVISLKSATSTQENYQWKNIPIFQIFQQGESFQNKNSLFYYFALVKAKIT